MTFNFKSITSRVTNPLMATSRAVKHTSGLNTKSFGNTSSTVEGPKTVMASVFNDAYAMHKLAAVTPNQMGWARAKRAIENSRRRLLGLELPVSVFDDRQFTLHRPNLPGGANYVQPGRVRSADEYFSYLGKTLDELDPDVTTYTVQGPRPGSRMSKLWQRTARKAGVKNDNVVLNENNPEYVAKLRTVLDMQHKAWDDLVKRGPGLTNNDPREALRSMAKDRRWKFTSDEGFLGDYENLRASSILTGLATGVRSKHVGAPYTQDAKYALQWVPDANGNLSLSSRKQLGRMTQELGWTPVPDTAGRIAGANFEPIPRYQRYSGEHIYPGLQGKTMRDPSGRILTAEEVSDARIWRKLERARKRHNIPLAEQNVGLPGTDFTVPMKKSPTVPYMSWQDPMLQGAFKDSRGNKLYITSGGRAGSNLNHASQSTLDILEGAAQNLDGDFPKFRPLFGDPKGRSTALSLQKDQGLLPDNSFIISSPFGTRVVNNSRNTMQSNNSAIADVRSTSNTSGRPTNVRTAESIYVPSTLNIAPKPGWGNFADREAQDYYVSGLGVTNGRKGTPGVESLPSSVVSPGTMRHELEHTAQDPVQAAFRPPKMLKVDIDAANKVGLEFDNSLAGLVGEARSPHGSPETGFGAMNGLHSYTGNLINGQMYMPGIGQVKANQNLINESIGRNYYKGPTNAQMSRADITNLDNPTAPMEFTVNSPLGDPTVVNNRKYKWRQDIQ